MELSCALSTTPVHRLKITWKGSDEVEKYCESRLIPFFDQNVACWKRQGRQFPFPLHVKFFMQFVPFSRDLLIDLSTNAHIKWEQHAFLHLFFMKPSTVDEYRNGSRNEVSEWFSTMNELKGTEWVIVFDSTKARDTKNRGAILERVKSDFSKFTNRIYEIHEGSSQCFGGLQTLIQSNLLQSLDSFVGYEESYLSALKENYKNIDFNFIAYAEYQMEMSRLYNTLGVLEHVLAKFDELDALLSMIVAHFAMSDSKPAWLCTEPLLGEGCPLLASVGQCNAPTQRNTMSLIEMRSLILAHQIIVSLRIFDDRVHHASDITPANTIQMKSDFAAIILKYANHCIGSICEEVSAMKLKVVQAQFQCWTVAFNIETLQFVSLLIQAAHVDNAAHFACSLSTRKCSAMTELGKCLESGDTTKSLVEWFEKGVASCENIAEGSNAVTEIRQILSDQQQFTHYMQKYHESSIALLKHFGWKRQSKLLGWHLANFLLSSDRVEGALPYLLKLVSSLIREGASITLLINTLILVVEHLDASPNLYFKQLADFYVILSIRSPLEKDRHAYCKKLFALLESNASTKLRRSVRSTTEYTAVRMSVKGIPSRITSTPGSILRITVTVTNELPLPIDDYCIRCVFKLIPLGSSKQKTNAGRNPLFECSYNGTDGVNRFGCIWKGDLGIMPMDSISSDTDVQMGVSDEVQKSIVFEHSSTQQHDKNTSLLERNNTIELMAEASEVGVYMMESIEIEIHDVLCVSFAWMDIPEIERHNSRRPMCFVQHKAPKVLIEPIQEGYVLSGVAQKVVLNVSSGSEPTGDQSTVLQVTAVDKDANLEFWDDSSSEWSDSCKFKVGSMYANDELSLTLHLCKSLRKLIKENEKDDDESADKQEICVRWLDKEWVFDVEFKAIMTVEKKTSLLEDKALYEMQISRTEGNDWVILPQEAILIEKNDSEQPKLPAKLLNPKLTAIVPQSTYRLVWALASRKQQQEQQSSQTSDTPIAHRIQLMYRVKTNDAFDPNINEDIYDREYEYREEVDFVVQTASYELCAQLLSSQPGAVLCRMDSTCDLIVSLRSLTNKVETVVVGVEADQRFWLINEKHKLLYVKESGLGQTSFSVVPKMVGFLPYPSITVFCCRHLRTPSDKSMPHLEQSAFGARLSSFIRTNSKQVHVLGAFSANADQKSLNSEKTGRLKEAKSRLTKLFD